MLSEYIFFQNFCPPIFVTQIFAPQYLWQVYADDFVRGIASIVFFKRSKVLNWWHGSNEGAENRSTADKSFNGLF